MASVTFTCRSGRRPVFIALLSAFMLFTGACSDQGTNKGAQEKKAGTPVTKPSERPVLNMAIFPRRNVVTTKKAFRPLADYLSEKLDMDVKMIVPLNFKRFWQGVSDGSYDLVHYNQYHYIVSHKKFGYEVLFANEEMGRNTISGSLIVHKNAGMDSVADLKGKRIVFGGGKKAMGSYIAPLAVLKEHGLSPDADFEVAFAKNPVIAVVKMSEGKYDAAGAGDVVLELKATRQRTKIDDLTILAKSEAFAQLPWAVKSDMPQERANKIQQIMTHLKNSEQGKTILQSARVTGFNPVTDADYDKVREIVRYAIGEQY